MSFSSSPVASREAQLGEFLGISPEGGQVEFYLPQFRGEARLEGGGLQYPGATFSNHDARAAFYVTSLVSRIVDPDNITVENAASASALRGTGRTSFLFGSLSNPLTLWVAERSELRRLFRFGFGETWRIEFLDKVVSIPDPSRLDEESYRSRADYGVVARALDPATRSAAFILAGLGDHATEGCAHFLTRHWQDLFRRFGGGSEFAVLVEFPPPVDPRQFRVFAEAAL